MNPQERVLQLRSMFEPLIQEKGFELVDMKLYQRGIESFLTLLVDMPKGGISLAGCTLLNREIREFIDKNALLAEPYNLEVSSPGIDRNLASEKDFLRVLNSKIRVFLREPVGGKLEFAGLLIGAAEKRIDLELDNGTMVSIPLDNINKAKSMF
jgi:ribosome maturation factor RimP